MQPTGLETRRLTAKLGPTCVGESPRLSTLTYRRSKNTSIPLPPGVCGKAYRPSQTSNHPVLCPHTALPPSLTSSTTFLLALTGETRRSPLRVDLPPDELLLSLSTPYVCAPTIYGRPLAQMEFLAVYSESVQGSWPGSSDR